jgi:ankyrin repeat protein
MEHSEIEPGCADDTRDDAGYTRLMYIAKSITVAQRQAGIDKLRNLYPVEFRKTIPGIDIQCTDEEFLGYTALHFAVQFKFEELWRFLIFHGADFTLFTKTEFPLKACHLFVHQEALWQEFELVCREQDMALCPLLYRIRDIVTQEDVEEFKQIVDSAHKDALFDVNRPSRMFFKNALGAAVLLRNNAVFDILFGIPNIKLDFQVPVLGIVQTCFVKKEYERFVSGGGFEVFLQTQMNVLTYAACVENYHAARILFDAGVDIFGTFYDNGLQHGPSLMPQLVFNAQNNNFSRKDALEMIRYVLGKNTEYATSMIDPFLKTYSFNPRGLAARFENIEVSTARLCVDANDPELLEILVQSCGTNEKEDLSDEVGYKISVFNTMQRNNQVGTDSAETMACYSACLALLT